MNAKNYYYLLLLLPMYVECQKFEQLGDGYYYIGSEKTTGRYFDWFLARRDCWRNVSNLVSVETSEELKALEDYVVSRGYPDGSTFATSGHNFNRHTSYSWEGADEPVDFVRWAPGSEVALERSYLSLVLANNSLYMRRSYGHDDYFICEYKLSLHQLWLGLDPTSRLAISILLCLVLLAVLLVECHRTLRWMQRRRSGQGQDKDKAVLIPDKIIV